MVNIRNYEVSIWTLQDSFISVLKQSNLENREKIQDPKMVLRDDGENTFSFKIPMYLQEDSDLTEQSYFKDKLVWKENPIWFNVRNGNLIASLRKIKVIFNKGTNEEEVFEFIINNIKESHEGHSKFCEVECGGLAFYELGRQGYEIVLSEDEFLADYQDWIDAGANEAKKPIKNIDYWIHKVLDNSNWTYIIDMDWSQYDGIIDKANRDNSVRQSNKIYRDPYISSWNIQGNKLIAANIVDDINLLEKIVTVDAKESNRYNLLQSIAEAFQVFCKFKYSYDDNYHITGRQVIFYNNFIKESEGVIDFNYGYNTSQITREMDGTDLISKMYVSPLQEEGLFSGEINLSDTLANPTLDNFLLNFEYLYKIGTISQEQYDEISIFQAQLRNQNLQIRDKNEQLLGYINQQPIEEAKLEFAKKLQEQALKRVAEASSVLNNMSKSKDGLLEYTTTNPRQYLIIHDADEIDLNYITIEKQCKAFIPNTFELYKEKNLDGSVNGTAIKNLQFVRDEDGYVTKVSFPSSQVSGKNYVYAIFKFNPDIPYDDIIKIWGGKAEQAAKDIADARAALGLNENDEQKSTGGLYNDIEECKKDIKELLQKRRELIAKFERIMGPALREGTWAPEDEYADYKINQVLNVSDITLSENSDGVISDGVTSFRWENTQISSEEQKLSYQFGPNETRYYPCIDLRNINLSSLKVDNLNLVYRDSYLAEYTNIYPRKDPRVNHYLSIGSETGCKFNFIRQKNTPTIIPVLIVVGADNITDAIVYNDNGSAASVISVADQLQEDARLSVISYKNTGELQETELDLSITWIENLQNYEIVYPRFNISINDYITTEPENKIYKDTTALQEYEDYYSLYHGSKYWITLKPETIIFNLNNSYSFYYTISNAAEAMYLDAIEVLRENSVPKVSYTMTPLAIDQTFIKNAYARIGQLAHVNDDELKFENVQGYISEVDLDLDKPWEDTYTIKNYKTKFEDLFSSIVAQTEAMQKNSSLLSMISNAFNTNGFLSDYIIDDIKGKMDWYIPTPEEIYSQYEPMIREMLSESFIEAGEVLAAAQKSVDDVNALNITNATILGSFVENIKNNMTPVTFSSYPRESATFKVGDFWQFTDSETKYEYLATENSSQIKYDSGENKLTSLKGWTRTQDGRLANITGASIDIDSVAGNISLKAANKIEVLAKTQLDLVSEDIYITGNNSINIGSKWINIAGTNGGINIVTSNITTSTATDNNGLTTDTSAVKMDQDGILIASSAGIKIKSATGINIYSSDAADTSAIKINKNDGIFLGSTQPIVMYSGTVASDASNSNYIAKGASVLISKDRILFGVANGVNGTAVDITKDQIIFGSSIINNNNSASLKTTDVGSKNGTAGVKITRNSIQLATGTATKNSDNTYTYNNRNYITMNSGGITLANADNQNNGAIVTISKSGVLIGVANDKTTFTNPISNGQAYSGTYNGAKFQVYAPNFVVDASGNLYAYNADIAGKIRAIGGTIGKFNITSSGNTTYNNGHRYTHSLYSQVSSTYLKNNVTTNCKYESGLRGDASTASSDVVFYVNRADEGQAWNNSTPIFYVRADGYLYAQNANITGSITATSFILGTNASIPQGKITGLTDDLNKIKAVKGTVTYQISSSGTSAPSGTWSTTVPATTDAKPFLWTKTVITYADQSTTSTSYSVSYKGKDGVNGTNGTNGTNGKYIKTITPLYYLKNSTSPTQPTNETSIASNDGANKWTTIVPTYPNNTTTAVYYRSDKQVWSSGNPTFTTMYIDYGLTVANQTATQASINATNAATTTQSFTNNGLQTNYKWGNITYPVAFTSNSSKLPMLIGANGGITIAKSASSSDGAAVVLDKTGIALHSVAINIKASSGSSTSAITLNKNGITMGTGGTISLGSGKFTVESGNFSITSGGYLWADGGTLGDTFIKGGSIELTGDIKEKIKKDGTSDGYARIGNIILTRRKAQNPETGAIEAVGGEISLMRGQEGVDCKIYVQGEVESIYLGETAATGRKINISTLFDLLAGTYGNAIFNYN